MDLNGLNPVKSHVKCSKILEITVSPKTNIFVKNVIPNCLES